MFDTVIINGNIVFPGRTILNGNIGIKNGKIADITSIDTKIEGANKIDANEKYVFPGVIEPHSHIGIGGGEKDLLTETRSASIGGVTTVLFFLRENTPYDKVYQKVRDVGNKNSYIDFSFHIVLITEEHLRNIPKYIEEYGITSFKHYFTYRGEDAATTSFGGNPIKFESIGDGYILESFKKLSNYPKAVAIVHAENIEIVQWATKHLKDAGKNDLESWSLSRPTIAEAEAVRRALFFAENTGCRVNILHLTSKLALNEALMHRKRYDDIFLEVCHPYLVFNENDVDSKKFKLRPPIRPKRDNEALWEAVKKGDINTIGSDHVPRKLKSKMGSIWSKMAGVAGTPYLFPIMLNEGYHKRGIPLTDIAKLLSLNTAQLYGLYPRKGDISIGSDADLVIVDLEKEYLLSSQDINQFSDFTLYDNYKVKGYPELTMVRGKTVYQKGKVIGEKGWGEFIAR
jgi:dihydropyrimidinase